jgi:hypothetical protein
MTQTGLAHKISDTPTYGHLEEEYGASTAAAPPLLRTALITRQERLAKTTVAPASRGA